MQELDQDQIDMIKEQFFDICDTLVVHTSGCIRCQTHMIFQGVDPCMEGYEIYKELFKRRTRLLLVTDERRK